MRKKTALIVFFICGIFTLEAQENTEVQSLTEGERWHQSYVETGREMRAQTRQVDCASESVQNFIKEIIFTFDSLQELEQRRLCLQYLGKTSCTEVISFYERVIQTDTSEQIRCDAIQYLGWIGAESSIPLLLERINLPQLSDYEKVCVGTFLSVLEYYTEAEPILNAYCYNTEERFCQKCIWAYYKGWNTSMQKYYHYQVEYNSDSNIVMVCVLRLAEYGDSTALPIFRQMLNSTEEYRRAAAINGLGLLVDKIELKEVLRKMQNDSSDAVKRSIKGVCDQRKINLNLQKHEK